jgi:ubiquinol oxidase
MSTPIVDLSVHHSPRGVSDRIALGFTKAMRFCADTFFAKRYGHRAIVLETVAAVPGMVGATLTHLKCLRRMCDDKGWIRTLMDEAENERMHLMTFIEVARPTAFERFVILAVQWVFYLAFFALYLVSARTAHRVVGYFEEEAVFSYTCYLKEIDEGRSPNVPAPEIARRYWGLAADATLRDVVLVVRADEAHHRDVNHGGAARRRRPHRTLAAAPERHKAGRLSEWKRRAPTAPRRSSTSTACPRPCGGTTAPRLASGASSACWKANCGSATRRARWCSHPIAPA